VFFLYDFTNNSQVDLAVCTEFAKGDCANGSFSTDSAVSKFSDIFITTHSLLQTKVQEKMSHVPNAPAEEIVDALEIMGELVCA